MDNLKRILFVDDSPRDTELAVDALTSYNLANEIVCLRDGVEALDYLYHRGPYASRTGQDPAVILLDLKMPRVDGMEVLRQIKGDPKLRVIPVVVMTSSKEDTDLARTYELGVNAYVVKPVKFDDFVEAIRQVGIFWAVLNNPPPSRPNVNQSD